MSRKDLIDGDGVDKIRRLGTSRSGEERLFRIVVTGFHAWVIQVLEHRHLVLGRHSLKILRGGEIAAFGGKEMRFVKPERVADEDDAFRRLLGRRSTSGTQIQRLQSQRQCGTKFEKFSAVVMLHFACGLRE